MPAGTAAPDFALKSTPDQTVKLSEFRGQPVVLVFYPADWSPVCGDQVGLYNEMLSEFQELGAEIIGISVDGVWCHAAFARDRKLHFPLLAIAQFERVPASMLLTLAATEVVISLFWLLVAKSLGDRIRWLV